MNNNVRKWVFILTESKNLNVKINLKLKAKEAMLDMQNQSVENGNSEMTMDEINAEIAEYRREKREAL